MSIWNETWALQIFGKSQKIEILILKLKKGSDYNESQRNWDAVEFFGIL